MMKRIFKYFLGLAIFTLLGYHSVYFEKLNERSAGSAGDFDAEAYARAYLEDELLPSLDQAVELNELLDLLRTEKEDAFRQYSHALGVGNIRFFLVQGEGTVHAVQEDHVLVSLEPVRENTGQVQIATEYIFGNAVRDASGLVGIHEFDNTMHLNEVSGEINRIIREEVLPPFKSRVKEGDRIQFTGALELNREHTDLDAVEMIPVTLEIPDSRR